MANNKSQLVVAAIENGTVIDHIPAEKTYQVVNLLQLEKMETPVTIGYNLPSKKIGKKGIIKVANKYFTDEEINRLSVVAPNIGLSIIKDYEIVEKKTVKTPDTLKGIPNVLVLLLDGEMHIVGKTLARHQHLSHAQGTLYDKRLVDTYQVLDPRKRKEIITDGNLTGGLKTVIDKKDIEDG